MTTIIGIIVLNLQAKTLVWYQHKLWKIKNLRVKRGEYICWIQWIMIRFIVCTWVAKFNHILVRAKLARELRFFCLFSSCIMASKKETMALLLDAFRTNHGPGHGAIATEQRTWPRSTVITCTIKRVPYTYLAKQQGHSPATCCQAANQGPFCWLPRTGLHLGSPQAIMLPMNTIHTAQHSTSDRLIYGELYVSS